MTMAIDDDYYLIYISPDKDPRVRLGAKVAKVIARRDGTAVVVSKETYTPRTIGTREKPSRELKPHPMTVTSGPQGKATGLSTITGKWWRIDTAPEYVAAAIRQGVPVEREGILAAIIRNIKSRGEAE